MLPVLLLVVVAVPAFPQEIWTPNKNACPSLIKYPFAFNPLSIISRSCYHNPNIGGVPKDIVRRAGYPYEQHYVTTEDGYILMIARIPQRKKGAQPVLLMHYLAGSSTIWLDRYNQSLAYALHDEGYDVWAGNVRGTTYSKRHVTLSPNQTEFWDYNLDTLAAYDLPTIVKYVAKQTGQGGNIIYGGVSMGCTLSYMYLVSQPEEAHALIRGIIHFAPAGYVHRSPTFKSLSYIRHLFPAYLYQHYWRHEPYDWRKYLWTPLAKILHVNALFEPEHTFSPLIQTLCIELPHICKVVLDIIIGHDAGQLDPSDFILELSSAIRPISLMQFLQYLQLAGDEKFQKFDYGKEKNLEVYGQERPPQYDLSKVKLPAFVFYGENDRIAVPKDVKKTFRELGSELKMLKRMTADNKIPFNHLDFNYGKDVKTLLFPQVIHLMKKYLKPKTST